MTTAAVQTTIRDEATVIELRGTIDGSSAAEIQSDVLPLVQPTCKLVVDMSQVEFLSSAGLRLMLLLFRQVSGQGGKMVFTGLSEEIRDTMSLTGFLDFLSTAESLEDGLAAVAG